MAAAKSLTTDERQALWTASLRARQRAYAPYSNFPVGAALLTASGEIVEGCNVENASFGLTVCAERVAVQAAVARGERSFRALAVATANACTPCGACRQVLAEFGEELTLFIVDANHPTKVTEYSLAQLLPESFRLRDGSTARP